MKIFQKFSSHSKYFPGSAPVHWNMLEIYFRYYCICEQHGEIEILEIFEITQTTLIIFIEGIQNLIELFEIEILVIRCKENKIQQFLLPQIDWSTIENLIKINLAVVDTNITKG